MSKFKIFHLIKSLGRGGAEMLLPETIRMHDRESFDFACCYFVPYKDHLVEDLKKLDCPVHCFDAEHPLQIFRQIPKVSKHIQEWGADLIHCHLPVAGFVGRMVSKRTGIPVIYTEHSLQHRYHPVTRWLNIRTMTINKLVINVSEEGESSIRNAMGRKAPKMKTLLNGVNTDRFNPQLFERSAMRLQYDIPDNAPLIGTVAGFRSPKRLDRWIKVAKMVHNTIPEARFVIIGDGKERDEIKNLTKELKLENQVTLTGRIDEVRPWLRAMDIYMISSEFEGLPIGMLEAMSMELPIVSTLAGGIGEVIRNEVEGLTTPVENWEKLSKLLIELIEHSDKRKSLGLNARQRVLEEFSIQRMVRELEEVYRDVINNN